MKTKLYHYFTAMDIIAIGSRSSRNPIIHKLIMKTDPLLVILGIQLIGFVGQMLLFLLPLTIEQQQWATVAGLINVLLTVLNTAMFLNANKKDLP